MLTLESTDKEILDHPLDKSGNKIRDVGGISFISWMTNKIDGALTYKAATQELLAFSKNPPISRRMPEAMKINIIRKMLSLGIDI